MTGDDFSIALNFASRNGYQIMTLHEFLAPTCDCLLEWDRLLKRARFIKQEHNMPDSFWVFFDPDDDDSDGFLLIGPTPDWLVGMASAYLDHLTSDDDRSERELLRQIRERAMACPVTCAAAAMVGLTALRDVWRV